MKISIDDKEVFTLSEIQKRVIQNDIHKDIFEEDMKRRIKYILAHKYEQCFKRLKEEWEQKLVEKGIKMIPTNPEEFSTLVFSQIDYKDRSQRDQSSIQ